MATKKKIFVVFSSASGHVNPVSGLVHELCRQPGIECIFYGIEDHRSIIEKTGAEFREYPDRNVADTQVPSLGESQPVFVRFMHRMIDSSYPILPVLVRDVEKDKPDMIIIDPSFIVARYLIEMLKKRHIEVKCVEFFPHFVMTQAMMESVPGLIRKDCHVILGILHIMMRQLYLNWHFGIRVLNPFELIMGRTRNLKVVSVFPELHPRLSDYDDTYKFVGQCALESTRSQTFDDELKSALESGGDSKNIIYMSLGTVYNNNMFIYEAVIEALKDMNSYKVIMSLGESGLKALKVKTPENFLLRAKVPQLDVLKKSRLFITHCGMNSASETIKYAVPIIGIPIEGDQLLVAHRLCDELQLGIRLEPLKLNAKMIREAVDKVLGDSTFTRNIEELSKISAKYNGAGEGAKHVMDYLQQTESHQKKAD